MKKLPSSGDLFCTAIQASLLIEEPAEAVNARLEIARTLWLFDQQDYALALLPDILLQIRELGDDRERAYLMRLFIELQCYMDRTDDARETLKLLDFDEEQRSVSLKVFALHLVQTGLQDEALKIAEEIEDQDDYEDVLEQVGFHETMDGKYEDAFETAEAIEFPENKARILLSLADVLWNAGRIEESERRFQMLTETLREIEDDDARDEMFAQTALLLGTAFRMPEAIASAGKITGAARRIESLVEIAGFFRLNGQPVEAGPVLHEARSLVDAIGEPFHRIKVLQKIGTALQENGSGDRAQNVFRETLKEIKTVGNAFSRSEMYADLAFQLADLELTEPARRVFRLAEKAAEEVESLSFRASCLRKILLSQARQNLPEDALETLQTIEELLENQSHQETADGRLARIIAISQGEIACSMLRQMLNETPEEAVEMLARGIAGANKISNPRNRTLALTRLAVARGRISELLEHA